VAIAIVQKKISTATVGASTHAQAFTSNVTAGNTIIVGVMMVHSPATTITNVRDNLNGAVNYAMDVSNNANSDGSVVAWYRFNNSAGGAMTVTATFSGASDSVISLLELSGFTAGAPTVNGSVGGANNNVTAHTSGNLVTTQTCVLFAHYGDWGYNTTLLPGTNWTEEQKVASNASVQAFTESLGLPNGAGPGSPAGTVTSGANSVSSVVLVAYEVPGGSGIPPGTGPAIQMRQVNMPLVGWY
jgi:hypothetical protein